MQDWPILSLFIARTKGVPFMPSVVGDVHKRSSQLKTLVQFRVLKYRIYVTKLNFIVYGFSSHKAE